MTNEKLNGISKLLENKDFVKQLEAVKDEKGACELFNANGVEVTIEEMTSFMNVSDEQKARIAAISKTAKKMEELIKNEEFKSKFVCCKTEDEMSSLLKENGIENGKDYFASMTVFAGMTGKNGTMELSEDELEEIVGGWRIPGLARFVISMIPVVGPIYTTIEDVSNMSGGGNIAARILMGVAQVAVDIGTTVSGTGLAGMGIKAALGKTITDAGARVAIGLGMTAIRAGQGYAGGAMAG